MSRAQIRSRERVRDLAEVYTDEREVNAMLDLVPDMFPSADDPGNTDRLFLEPACGHGNFLVEILSRKLRYVTPKLYGREEIFEHRLLRCLASIYGIDICDDNVKEARERMTNVVAVHVGGCLGDAEPSPGFGDAVAAILSTNIIRGDTLRAAAEIELVEYRLSSDGTFLRRWSYPLDPCAAEPNLFSLATQHEDAVPVHYAKLAFETGPTMADVGDREAA